MSTPAVVAAIAAGRPVAAVWRNELGGVTFSIDGGLGADLAVATLSLSWNYGGEWEHVGAPPACGGLLDAYGVEPDRERVEHYRPLWNAGDVSSH